LDKLAKPFLALAPMDDVTDTVFRQIIATLPYPSHLDAAQGASEERTEAYMQYVEGVPQLATQRSAKSTGGVPGYARQQAGAVRRYGPDLFMTEFVNVDGLQSPGRPRLLHKLALTDKEHPILAQIWGLKPENFYKTVKEMINGTLAAELEAMQGKAEKRSKLYQSAYSERASQALTQQRPSSDSGATGFASRQAGAVRGKRGFDGVDLNFGCPVKTVIKNGACAALIKNRKLAGEIIAAVKEAAHSTSSGQAGQNFPVTVKTRLGFNQVDLSWLEFLLGQKLNMLSIHLRTAKELSDVPAHWDLADEVRQRRDALAPETLLVGNGDVPSRAAALKLAKAHQLDGVMIGRGVFHDPFLFAEDSLWSSWSKAQKLDLFARHIELFAKTYPKGERKFETLRKFCKVYINGFDGASELRAEFMRTTSPEQTLALLAKAT